MGDRIACHHHGVQVHYSGSVTQVPGSPGRRMEGLNCVRSFHVQERHGAIWLHNARENLAEAAPLVLPQELEAPEYSHFLCYTEWKCDYR